jgi:hypothetical protein
VSAGEIVWQGNGLEYVLANAGRGAAGWYYAEVSNEAGRVESGRVEVAVLEAVGILREPESREVETEGRVVLGIEAKGGGVLQYQWYRNGIAIEGAVGRELILDRARVEDRGLYRVVVFNGVSSTSRSWRSRWELRCGRGELRRCVFSPLETVRSVINGIAMGLRLRGRIALSWPLEV